MMIVAVITTRNEAGSIGPLARALAAQGLPAIVVDAASTDGTALEAHWAGAHVIAAGRRPIGPALMLGWREALAMEASRIVQIDAGGSHDPADLPRLLAVDADLVVGSRFCPGGCHVGNPWRALLSRAAAAACNWAQSGARYADWTSGYRVLSARCARYLLDVPYRATMHGWQIETLARAGEAGLSIQEVPITYTAGRSSLNRAVAWEAFLVWNDLVHHIGWVGSRLREEGLS